MDKLLQALSRMISNEHASLFQHAIIKIQTQIWLALLSFATAVGLFVGGDTVAGQLP
jgi:hypothetical protein